MHLRQLLSYTPALALGLAACTQDNPLFIDCRVPNQCVADDSGAAADDEPGDGDDEPGDGDDEPGDGDGEPGDGDGEPGDGDGEPAPHFLELLPTCPDTTPFSVELVEDTFLVHYPYYQDQCLTSWNFEDNAPIYGTEGLHCKELDFGAALGFPVCSSGVCDSKWLGRFNVAVDRWDEFTPTIWAARVKVTAWTSVEFATPISLHPVLGPSEQFGPCGTWKAGNQVGGAAEPCVTTWRYSAKPKQWPAGWHSQFTNTNSLGDGAVPAGLNPAFRSISIALNEDAAQMWFDAGAHPGLIMGSTAQLPWNFILFTKESITPPTLEVDLCQP